MANIPDLKIRQATSADRAEHLRMRFALWGKDNSLGLLDAEIDEALAVGRGVLLAEAGGSEVVGGAPYVYSSELWGAAVCLGHGTTPAETLNASQALKGRTTQ